VSGEPPRSSAAEPVPADPRRSRHRHRPTPARHPTSCEAYRHGKPLAAYAGGEGVLAAAGVSTGGEAVLPASSVNAPSAGVVTADDGGTAVGLIAGLLGSHRAWDRFPAVPGL
jgi:hypothetical protein